MALRDLVDTQAETVEKVSAQSHRYAWYVTIVLMLCYTLSFVDRQILSLLVPQIKACNSI